MVGKIKIIWAGGYHPDLGKSVRDPALDKREARKEKAKEKAKEKRQEPVDA
jgi:hypothetical protein